MEKETFHLPVLVPGLSHAKAGNRELHLSHAGQGSKHYCFPMLMF